MSLYHSLGTSKITASPFLLITSINEPIKAFSGAEATSTLTPLDTQICLAAERLENTLDWEPQSIVYLLWILRWNKCPL